MSFKRLKLNLFKFDLPKELIASRPSKERDESKMMVVNRKNRTIEHKQFKDIVDYFEDGDSMVINNSKVFPARLFATKEKTKAKIEIFLLRELNPDQNLWDVIVDPARKIRIGNKLFFDCPGDENLVAEVIDNTTSRGRSIRFLYDGEKENLKKLLHKIGNTPLPKYIKRKPDKNDGIRYQTIYAKETGSVAAPTAGLHFTKNVMKKLEIVGVNFPEITLHVGLGTFRQLEVEDLSKHRMDAEWYTIPPKTADTINTALDNNKKVCSIGTTTLRALESSYFNNNRLSPKTDWTNKFIHPPQEVKVANALLTNFHLPLSSLLVLVCTFADYELIMEAYKTAVKEKYRFYSYGDCMLIL